MPRPFDTARGRRGVTLIEVVIAIFVLSVGILGIMSLFPAGYRLTRMSVERSVAALAARHALARVVGKTDQLDFDLDPATEPLSYVAEAYRVGTIKAVTQTMLTCKVLGNITPGWPSLNGYYLVMTSGSAEGHFYKINTNTSTANGQDVTFQDSIQFRTGQSRKDEPVRVGDHFAVIGCKTGTDRFPARFIDDTVTSAGLRTIPVATYGSPDAPRDGWRYSYGCILSAPPPEMTGTFRLDIFVYRGFPYKCPETVDSQKVIPKQTNQLTIGHYVAYMSGGKVGLAGD